MIKRTKLTLAVNERDKRLVAFMVLFVVGGCAAGVTVTQLSDIQNSENAANNTFK